MVGAPYSDCFQSCRYQIGDDGFFLQQQCKWSWPETLREGICLFGYLRNVFVYGIYVVYMNDQRVECRPVFYIKDFCNRRSTQGISRQAINRFSGNCDELTLLE